MAENPLKQHVITVKRNPGDGQQPRLRRLHARSLSDYPRLSAAHKTVVRKLASPLFVGPPVCDEMIAFVQHLFTEEEASIVRHLAMSFGRSAEALARAERRPVEGITPILRRLAFDKFVIGADGPTGKERYKLMPVYPGIWEMVLIGRTPETLTSWHFRFIELFETLFETGYAQDYLKDTKPVIRFLSVGKTIEAHPMALPSDRLEVVLDRFNSFALGSCQCRMSDQVLGRGCRRPLEYCVLMGVFAEKYTREGKCKSISRRAVLDVKREAEESGLATWIMNVESTKGQICCSCCSCCCHGMRMVREFNAPGFLAPAHFRPTFDPRKCSYCGRCARACPMDALVVDTHARTHRHNGERCIGCGLCAVACDTAGAVAMDPVREYALPYKSWFSMLLRSAPTRLHTAWRVWKER